MTDRQTVYRLRQKTRGLVQFNIWCRPQDREAIRAYARMLTKTNPDKAKK